MSPAEAAEPQAARRVRCAIYTRKSTEEGLGREFNSLDAQRECAEAYILSQRQEGWTVLPQRYDDGGFTGANLDRPALQRLLADIQAGGIDCVVIYKVDRLSRSLFDFARLMQIFEQHGVSFVSVTQQLNSNTPMGRLTLNVLLSFAQFEREIISERTRDRKSAARRKGKWMGGCLVLGYDPDPGGGRLTVNAGEAEQVREIFAMFLRYGSLAGTLEEIHSRGWGMKNWTTRKGKLHAGRPFDRPALVRLLSNVLYRGEVNHKGKVYPGEQPAIIDPQMWQQANDRLRSGKCGRQAGPRNPQGALLKDLLKCSVCGSRMVAGYTTKGQRRYGYYVCRKAQQKGAQACPGQSIAAPRIEQAVVAGLYAWAERADRQQLREELQGSAGSGREGTERQRILAEVVERIDYDGRSGQARLQLRTSLAEGEEIPILVPKNSWAQPSPPPRMEAAPGGPLTGRLPRITRLLALAVRFEGLLRDGIVKDYAELARLGGVSRARITQVMSLRNLAPAIQERILWLPATASAGGVLNERMVRRATQCADWRQQMRMFEEFWTIPCSRNETWPPGRNTGVNQRPLFT
ncbi:MAG: recombinase family protein [Bryobacteraceae bacterium]